MMETHAENDVERYDKLNDRIHEAIVEASRNRTLADFHGMLAGHVERVRNLVDVRKRPSKVSKEEHEDVMAALLARSQDAARHRMAAHVGFRRTPRPI